MQILQLRIIKINENLLLTLNTRYTENQLTLACSLSRRFTGKLSSSSSKDDKLHFVVRKQKPLVHLLVDTKMKIKHVTLVHSGQCRVLKNGFFDLINSRKMNYNATAGATSLITRRFSNLIMRLTEQYIKDASRFADYQNVIAVKKWKICIIRGKSDQRLKNLRKSEPNLK